MPKTTFSTVYLATVPLQAGVYQFFDAAENIIYVGKAKSLRRRLQQYKNLSRTKRDRKGRSIVAETFRISYETCENEQQALLKENQLIQTLNPKFNTAGSFTFLYPVIAANFTDGRLRLVHTTSPEAFESFQLFGTFRDRNLVKEAFESLMFIFSLLAHKEPPSRMVDVPKAPYTKRLVYRQFDQELWIAFTEFLQGRDDRFLGLIFEALLSSVAARGDAKKVQTNLKTLKIFYAKEARALKEALISQNMDIGFLSQADRDRVFINARFPGLLL